MSALSLAFVALLIVALPVVATLGARPANAQSGLPEYTASGPYVSFGGTSGFPLLLQSELSNGLPGKVDVDAALGVQARAGYRFHPRLAAEVQYDHLREIDVREKIKGVDDRIQANIPIHTVTANVKGFVFGQGIAQSYLLGGVGIMSADAKDISAIDPEKDDTVFAGRVAAGVDVYPGENFSFFGELSYVMPTDSLQDLAYLSLSVGITVHFR